MSRWMVTLPLLFAPMVVLGASVPELRYFTSAGDDQRRLIFSNNPEEIRAEYGSCDLADSWAHGVPCARSLLRIEGVVGNYRDWWEHSNRTEAPVTYGVRLYNPGPLEAQVVVRGAGFVPNALRDGGREFIELFRGAGATRFSLPAGSSRFVFKSSPVDPGLYFAGVVDFDVSGAAVVVDNLALVQEPAPITHYLGYERRVRGAVHESLVYKGLSHASVARATGVDFDVGDEDAPQRLKVIYPRYLQPVASNPPAYEGVCAEGRTPPCMGYVGSFSESTEPSDSWVTHIGPDPDDPNPKRRLAVVSDMVSIFMPGFPAGCSVGNGMEVWSCFEISPFYKWFHQDFGHWKYPNLGNWAVHYVLEGTITNRGRKPRLIRLGLRGDGSSPLAYRAQKGPWLQFVLRRSEPHNPDDYFPYGEFWVQPGESLPYSGEIVLSGPANGTLEHLVALAK